MKVPIELCEFALQVALVPPDDWEAFMAAAAKHVKGTPANMAHAVNAFANQWTRNKRAPNNYVAALVALLDPEKRDRLTAQSWTVKKWVQGKRAEMLKAAGREAERLRLAAIEAAAAELLALAPEVQRQWLDDTAHALAYLEDGGSVLAAHGLNAVQAARHEMRTRRLVVCGGLAQTDLGCALAAAHSKQSLERMLTAWVIVG